jgi:hypothetical protein
MPRGRLSDPTRLELRGDDGERIPLQAEVLDRWSDGSARWVLLDFPVNAEPRGEVAVSVEIGGSPTPAWSGLRVEARETSAGLMIDTGRAQFTLDRDGSFPFRSVRAGGIELVDAARSGWTLTDETGGESRPTVRTMALEARGPIRATARLEGTIGALEFTARLHFHVGSGAVRAVITMRNPRRAEHPGGVWELGDSGSVRFRDSSLHVATAGRMISWSPETSAPLSTVRGDTLSIYQDSSGGENWRSRVHVDREGELPLSFRGYRVRVGTEERTGLRATPRVAVHGPGAGVAASMQHFWQNFPKAMDADDGILSVRLFPGQSDHPHELQGGEQKTHEVWLTFGPEATAPEADAQRSPLVVHPEPDWFETAGAIPYLTARERDANGQYLALVDQAIEGDSSLQRKREIADEYGWRHFGETWADHESKYWEGEGTFISHYNNQYDVVYGALLQFARSGDERWWHLMVDLARHVIDIDIYHCDEDKAAYNQGLFWHTVHYVDAGLCNHRSYPKGTVGGGPDSEHNYTTGLMHYTFLTGDPLGRETAIGSARWVVAADDGNRTPFRWLSHGPTGLASKTRDFDYHGPGRGSGNSINALLDGWRLTGDPALLEKCDEIIRRTVHPDDDPGSHGLLDSENRWSYTVHLQALGKYLDVKAEAGRLDLMYAYARESLLTYARWMAEHERPILDRPDELEFPNETWAAQDIRKSDVFKLAALHAQGDERDRFVERGEWFFRNSLTTLDGFDTKGYLRPIILLMHYGPMQAWFDHHADDARPRPDAEPTFEPRPEFVPQKTRAIHRAKALVVVVGGAVLLLGSAVVLSLLR